MKSSTKSWMHPPDALLRGEIAFNVKFLGECPVDQPKGTETVKEAIKKRNFNKHVKRAEGQKPPKVQLVISANGVRIEHTKSRTILHEHPLHRISYCADDKTDTKMFTFIAKAATTSDHYCYVFNCSEKSAEEITLTVGQAFDLAYKRFLEDGSSAGHDSDYKKQCLLLQRRVNSLQFENDALKKRVAELEKMKDRSDLDEYMRNNQLSSLTSIMLNLRDSSDEEESNETSDYFESSREATPQSQVGRRLDNLILQDNTSQSNGSGTTNPAPQASPGSTPVLSPPPPSTRQSRTGLGSNVTAPVRQQSLPTNPFFSRGFEDASSDPFGMGTFNPPKSAPAPVAASDAAAAAAAPKGRTYQEIEAGFIRGLSFGTYDFHLNDQGHDHHRDHHHDHDHGDD